MNKIRKILMELRAEYLQKRNCLVGTATTKGDTDKTNFKINMYTKKIDEINDALLLEEKDE